MLSALPLVLLPIVLIVWAASYAPQGGTYLRAVDGQLVLMFLSPAKAGAMDDPNNPGDTRGQLRHARGDAKNRAHWGLLGFEFICGPDFDSYSHTHVILGVPFAAIALLLAAAALWWSVTYRARRQRALPGHCAHCGYNLRGNTTGRCPECGTATAPSAVN